MKTLTLFLLTFLTTQANAFDLMVNQCSEGGTLYEQSKALRIPMSNLREAFPSSVAPTQERLEREEIADNVKNKLADSIDFFCDLVNGSSDDSEVEAAKEEVKENLENYYQTI